MCLRLLKLFEYGEAILDAISTCSAIVVMLSEETNSSIHVQKEVERAVSMGKKVIPFRIADVRLSKSLEYFLSSEQWFDAVTPPLDAHIDRLVSALFKDLAGHLIGRGRELAYAEDIFKDISHQNGSLLLISGNAGRVRLQGQKVRVDSR